jgi:hypothetical protein
MRTVISSGLRLGLTFLALARMAPACGDPNADATARPKAKRVVQTSEGAIRIGEAVYANLILPQKSPLPTGTLSRTSCTSFQFKVEPKSGWHDPWAAWYNSGIPQHPTGTDGPQRCGVEGGVLMIMGRPAPAPPPQIHFTLNDWVQFDRPGKYKISATYRTEFRSYQDQLDDPYDDHKTAERVTLATDEVEIEVLPEAANAADKAEDSLTQLGKYYGNDDPVWEESRPFDLPDWAAYSQSDAVVPLLAQFFESRSELAMRGLIASPHQDLVVREMENRLVDPRHSVSFFFMDVLALNAARLRHPELFGESDPSQWSREWEELARKRNQVYLAALAAYTQKLLSAIPRKHAPAQNDSLSAALLVLSRWDVRDGAELRKKAAREAAELWLRMKDPANISDEEWRVVASPALLPFLRKNPQFYNQEERWLFELAPQEAWQRLIRSAAQANWDTAWSWAYVMPEASRTSAGLDRHLLKALQEGSQDDRVQTVINGLLLRFGGAELVNPVRRLLDSETCMGEPALWAFLLKYEGAGAESELLQRYSERKSDVSCEVDVALQEVLQSGYRYWSPKLEEIVDSQLYREDPIAFQAAGLLRGRGSRNAESVLWSRLEKWHRSPPFRAGRIDERDDLEYALINALHEGQAWLPDESMIQRLHRLCVYECESLKWARSTDKVQSLVVDGMRIPPLFMRGYASDPFREFEAGLARFPAGTRFEVKVMPGFQALTSAQIKRRHPELGRLLREHKLIVVDTLAFDEFGRCRQSLGSEATASAE